MSTFQEMLTQHRVIVTDGAMGTLLQAAGMPVGQNSALMVLDHPEVVERIHAAYCAAGSDIVFANTFSASAPKLEGTGHSVEEVISAAVACAKQAAAPTHALVALDIGPLGELLEPLGTLAFETAVAHFGQMVRAGAAAGADLIAIETMMDLYEAKAALLAAREESILPVMVTMTFEASGRTFTGCGIPEMALTLEGLGADVIGINCSVGPKQLTALIAELSRWTRLPIAVKPNAGLPRADGGYDLDTAGFAAAMRELVAAGATVVGGCCGTSPAEISALHHTVAGMTPPVPGIPPSAVCSSTRCVLLDAPRVVGERLNPTGKKLLRAAIQGGDMGYLMRMAAEQEADGAEIIDINVGVPGIDEVAMLPRAVRAVQSVCSLPLQLDSANPDALEAALRICNGRAIVNSVNGKDAVLARLLPVVRRYGALVIGLALGEDGIPETAQGRVAIAEKILACAAQQGIPRDDVIIDCLTLTVGSGDQNAAITLDAVGRMTAQGIKTALGVSNVSFGLPRRDLVNRTFLTLALGAGLTLPIMNPKDGGMMEALDVFRLLSGHDAGGARFIERYAAQTTPAPAPASPTATLDLASAICAGLEHEAAAAAAAMLTEVSPETLISMTLIPALDEVGRRYEQGAFFLPQLIRAAGAAKAACDIVRERLAGQDGGAAREDVIVLATVQGDIHDIGKNIVRAVLENYGYHMIDLGRDVAPSRVVEAVKQSGARLVGLSALMTTTLPAMRETIQLLAASQPTCRVVVGGAVLTQEYARAIGAHFYARDAAATVEAAREVFGQPSNL